MLVVVRAEEQRIKSFCSPLQYLLAKSFVRTECTNHSSSKQAEEDSLLTEVINKIKRLSLDQKHGTVMCFKILVIYYPYKKDHIKYIDT